MSFKFALRQRVVSPHGDGAQGVVIARSDFIGRENEYHVSTLRPDGRQAQTWIGESDLLAANAPVADAPSAKLFRGQKRKRSAT